MILFASLGIFLAIMLISIPLSLWRAYVGTILWDWFITPVFHIPSPSVVQLWGLFVVIALITARFSSDDTEHTKSMGPYEKMAYGFGMALLIPAFALFCGWIVTWFM